jgi:hypothetical protein
MNMMPDSMTADAWEIWFIHAGTEALMQRVQHYRDQLQESLGSGRTVVPESMEQTAMLTAKMAGEIAGLDYVLKREFMRNADSGDEED